VRRSLFIVALAAALVAGIGTAEAAISQGKFKGLVGPKANGDAFGFKVNKSGQVTAIYATGVTLTCTDGDKFDTKTVRSPKSTAYPVGSDGKWSFSVENSTVGNGYGGAGKFKSTGKSSKGTFEIHATFDEQNNPDPGGSVKCTSGTLKWSVKRQ
jgi:hypothetical protein